LFVDTFVAAVTVDGADEQAYADADGSGPEALAILRVCRRMRSVAEVAGLVRVPLGVVKVLIGDLADQGRIRVYENRPGPAQPDRAVLERVLSGLRSL
jgi:hypothetical protein